ncbi:MAG TPA: hypothetical protein VNH83_05590 [Bryobacteraceae bacterium]|jgi:hypothetical protein|nr:hypothetical protein [Bryobacteraceae bacterium]
MINLLMRHLVGMAVASAFVGGAAFGYWASYHITMARIHEAWENPTGDR